MIDYRSKDERSSSIEHRENSTDKACGNNWMRIEVRPKDDREPGKSIGHGGYAWIDEKYIENTFSVLHVNAVRGKGRL